MGKNLTIELQPTAEIRNFARSQMPVAGKWAYFDHAAVAPLPLASREAMASWLRQASEEGDTCWPKWQQTVENLRSNSANLLQVEKEEIALIPNTSTGISLISEGFPWSEGDNVVLPDNEFPSNALPWQHLASRGVEARRVSVVTDGEFDLQNLAKAIDSRTRLLAISWVGFSNGIRTPLGDLCELAKSKGIPILLDAIQGLGVFPLDLGKFPIDFVAADGHKWMLGPEGAGILFIRKKWIDRIRPNVTGWGSVQQSWKFSAQELHWKESASRFEAGSANMAGLIGLNASLQMLLDFGCHQPANNVERTVLQNVEMLAEGLQRKGAIFRLPARPEARSGIISFELPGKDPDAVRQRLLESGVVLSVRQGKLRASTHCYNNEDDFQRLIVNLP